MRKSEHVFGKYFCGNEISKYGRENGFVDYATFAKAFDAVLNNEIMQKTYDVGYWDQENGYIDNSEEIEELEDQIEELEDQEEEDEETTAKIEELREQIEELEEEQERQPDIFQYYIVSDNGAEIIKDYTNEILFYNEELDMYIWGVTHYGTSWDYVLTDIKCEKVTKEGEKA